MNTEALVDELLPPELVAEIEVAAAAEHRPAREIVREAIELYLQERRTLAANRDQPRTPAEAAARILELRKGNILPEGETIRDLINYGRA